MRLKNYAIEKVFKKAQLRDAADAVEYIPINNVGLTILALKVNWNKNLYTWQWELRPM